MGLKAKLYIEKGKTLGTMMGSVEVFEIIETTDKYVIADVGFLSTGRVRRMKFHNGGKVEKIQCEQYKDDFPAHMSIGG